MNRSNKKQKGKLFETIVSNLIHNSLILFNQDYKTEFEKHQHLKPHRDFSSGVFKVSYGDIDLQLAKTYFPFFIECKFWKSLDLKLSSIFSNKINSLLKVYNDTKEKSSKKDLKPIVVFKGNYTPIFVLFENDLNLDLKNYIKIDSYTISKFDEFLEVYFK